MRRTCLVCLALAALALAASPVHAFKQVKDGVYRLDLEEIDELLILDDSPEVRLMFVSQTEPQNVSDVHIQAMRDWVARGGVLWAEGEGLRSALLRSIVPVEARDFDFYKTTGGWGGELIVKGALPQHVIHDHPLTEGVERLYLYPRRDFTATPKLEPLVEMTNPEGERAVVIGAVPHGRGYVVLDGTARETRRAWWPFRRNRSFDEDHPNAVRLGERWDSYDWDELIEAAERTAADSMQGTQGG
jgi:hypothetical protein